MMYVIYLSSLNMTDFCIDGCVFHRIGEFEARSLLSTQHSEGWYMARIWTIIDKVFADVEALETAR
jgi:hypothetical protein